MIINLGPDESRIFPLTGKYLIARRVSGQVVCDDPTTGLPQFSFRQGDNIELLEQRQVRLTNKGNIAAVVDVESSPVKIYGNEGSNVSIIGGEITRIVEPIAVTAQATVENGTVTSQSPTTMSQAADITVPAGQRVKLVSADASTRKTAFVQNISAAFTNCRIGGATVGAGSGLLLSGSQDAPAVLEIDCKGDIYAHNESGTAAKFAVMWAVR